MKAKKVSESIRFERGLSPGAALGIGRLEYAKERLGEIAEELGWVEVMIDSDPSIIPHEGQGATHSKWVSGYGSLVTLFSFDRKKPSETLGVYANRQKSRKFGNSKSEFEKPEDWYTEQKWVDFFDIWVAESQNFERGKDPLDAMDLGMGPVGHLLEKIDKLSKQFGFKRVDPQISTEEYGNIQLAKWIRQGDNLEIWAYRAGDEEPVALRNRRKSGIFAVYKLSHWGAGDDKLSAEEWAEEWPWENNFGSKRYEWVKEEIGFERGQDPKRAMNVGHAKIYPAKTMFLDIYDYCKKNKHPGFERVSDINWNLDNQNDPVFHAYVNEGKEKIDDKNYYSVYLADSNRSVVTFHEYRQFDGDWRDVDDEITSIDHWRRLMEANHAQYFSVKEAQNFERGQDPYDALDIGRNRSEITLDMDKSNGRVATPQAEPLEAAYDIRKFFQNIEMGLYPSNLGIMFHNKKGEPTYVYSDDLKDWGFERIKYEGKFYDLG